MITCTSLGGAGIQCDLDGKTLSVFPNKKESVADLKFLASPDEDPKEGEISWPGEYDVDNLAVRGIGHSEGKRVSYVLEVEDRRLAFISSPLHEWSDHEIELLGDVDVLFLPADDAKIAQKLIDAIDPRVLIPLPTKDEKVFEELLKICGAVDKEISDEYKLKGSMPAEGREIVILKPKK